MIELVNNLCACVYVCVCVWGGGGEGEGVGDKNLERRHS